MVDAHTGRSVGVARDDLSSFLLGGHVQHHHGARSVADRTGEDERALRQKRLQVGQVGRPDASARFHICVTVFQYEEPHGTSMPAGARCCFAAPRRWRAAPRCAAGTAEASQKAQQELVGEGLVAFAEMALDGAFRAVNLLPRTRSTVASVRLSSTTLAPESLVAARAAPAAPFRP